jgi:transposase-like protein
LAYDYVTKSEIKCPECNSTDCDEEMKTGVDTYEFLCTDCGEQFNVRIMSEF